MFKISTLKSRFKKLQNAIRMLDSQDKCEQEPYLERKSFGFKNIRIGVDTA